jgi:hypothetical protein
MLRGKDEPVRGKSFRSAAAADREGWTPPIPHRILPDMELRDHGSRLSASDLASLPDDERRHELEAGWLVSEPLPMRRSVTTYRELLAPRVVGPGDVLNGEDALTGLEFQVGSIFEFPRASEI